MCEEMKRGKRFVRDEGEEPKKGKTYVIIGVGVLIAVGLLFGVVWFADVDGYLQKNKEIINLYNFYDSIVGFDTDAVYFIGSSMVAESVYPPLVNELIHEKGYENITVYSAYLSGDTPITRSTQIQKIIDSRPKHVIYGLTPAGIGADDWREEYYSLVHDRLNIRDDSLYLYTPEQVASFNVEPNLFYKKKFIGSALQEKINNAPSATLNYSYDPLGVERRQYISSMKNEESILSNVNNPLSHYRVESEVSADWTQNKEALLYIINTLKNEGISVSIMNMPINPLLSEKISTESYDNYYALLNNTGVSWINMDGIFSSEYFFDEVHMTYDGAVLFAPYLADYVIQEMT